MRSEVVTNFDRQRSNHLARRCVGITDVKEIVLDSVLEDVLAHTGSKIQFDRTSTAAQASIDHWFYYKLRDRHADGPGWQTDRLTDWSYDKQVDVVEVPAVEESTYWLDPRGCLSQRYETADRNFIVNPFEVLPEGTNIQEYIEWNQRYERLIHDPLIPFPGYFSDMTIPGLRRLILDRSLRILGDLGYAQLTAVPTWFHIAKMYEHLGFQYSFEEDKNRIEIITEALAQSGVKNRVEMSWVVMRQFWAQGLEQQLGIEPEEVIKKGKVLRDNQGRLLTYPLTPERNLWMYRWI